MNNDLAVVLTEFKRLQPGAVEGLSIKRRLLDPALGLSDFEVQFTDEATAQNKTALRNRVQTFIGWTVEEREAYLAPLRPKTDAERIEALEAQVAELLTRVSALENV